MDNQNLVDSIRGALSDDLLKPEYRNRPDRLPSAGHCYAASEAAYHMLGGKAAGWTPMNIRHEGDPHWFLKHQDGTILDPTADQFQTPVPYDQARGKGFLTSQPSARAQTIINKVQAASPQVTSRKASMKPYFVRVANPLPPQNVHPATPPDKNNVIPFPTPGKNNNMQMPDFPGEEGLSLEEVSFPGVSRHERDVYMGRINPHDSGLLMHNSSKDGE